MQPSHRVIHQSQEKRTVESKRENEQIAWSKTGRSCYPGPMRGMSWCSDSVDRYLFSSSTRCLCVFAPPSRRRRSSSLLRLISSCRRWASVFPVPVLLVGTALPLLLLLLFSRSCSSSSSCSTEACRASAVLRLSAGLLCSLSTSPWPSLVVVELSATLFFLLLLLFFFFLMPLSFAPPFSFNPPDTVEV